MTAVPLRSEILSGAVGRPRSAASSPIQLAGQRQQTLALGRQRLMTGLLLFCIAIGVLVLRLADLSLLQGRPAVGANRIASASALDLNGGTLELINAGGLNGQTFASLSLTGNSTLDLNNSTSLSFTSVGSVGGGLTLSVLDFYVAASPDYAFRFLGDLSGNSTFLSLIGATTVNGLAAAFNFDGSYTNVAPVPLPAAWLLLMSGLGLFGAAGRRRKAMARGELRQAAI